MSSLILLNSISSKYRHSVTQIEKHAPYVLEELATVFIATGSVFEAIEYVSRGGYKQVSSAFSNMITLLNQGVPPEQLLMNFAAHQPSITLRRGLMAFIHLVEASNTNLDSVILDAHEGLQRHYERLTLQWESRMMVYSGVLVFLPIIILLGAAIRGLADNPLILILPVFQFGISKMMKKILLAQERILLGE
jgi:pilus assembly protein TadC